MCQAFEGERNSILAHEEYIRRKGYDAQKAGVPRDANPERDHTNPEYSDKRQWWFGYDTAVQGQSHW